MQVNGMLLEGKKVYVGPFLKRTDRPADKDVRFTNVFAKNLAESVDDEKLREMFAAYGEVTSAIIMKVSFTPQDQQQTQQQALLRFEMCKAALFAVG